MYIYIIHGIFPDLWGNHQRTGIHIQIGAKNGQIGTVYILSSGLKIGSLPSIQDGPDPPLKGDPMLVPIDP